MASTETVKVIVRSRPLNKTEKERGNFSIVQFDRSLNQVSIIETKTQLNRTFAYDSVFDDTFTQQQLYDESAFPLVESTLKGYNSTIFAQPFSARHNSKLFFTNLRVYLRSWRVQSFFSSLFLHRNLQRRNPRPVKIRPFNKTWVKRRQRQRNFC